MKTERLTRRGFLAGSTAIGLLAALGWRGLVPAARAAAQRSFRGAALQTARSHGVQIYFNDPQFSYQLLRALSATAYGAADIAECLSTAYRIKEGDFESWYAEWYRTAERLRVAAETSLAANRRVSARDAFLRACTYYRAAEFYLHGNAKDPRILATWSQSRDAFRKLVRLSTGIEPIEIPYEGTHLPGYFFRAQGGDDGLRPLLILQTGFDGTLEELYSDGAAAVTRRGFHCLAFEGPGQGAVIREQKLPFRPDWEKVVTPVVDYALTRPEVDTKRIALMGISFGGYLAPRAAAYEHRLAACIADGGVYSLLDGFAPKGMTAQDAIRFATAGPDDFNASVWQAAAASPTVRWGVENGLFTFDVATPAEWFMKVADYTMEGHAGKIVCPTLIVDSEHDTSFPGQARKLYNALTCPKEWMLFTTEEGGEEHCQAGALLRAHERIFDWLEATLLA